MLHRQTEVKLRDNQENRTHGPAFPKTPKNAAPSSTSLHFVTPANKPRMALGAKSTNVHHRQPFSSASKTGKRHSPVLPTAKTIAKPVFKLSVPLDDEEGEGLAEPLEQSAGAALRAALDRALATGIDVPEPEYAPPPVTEELPFAEPDGMEPMDWPAFHAVCQRARSNPASMMKPSTRRMPVMEDPMPVFVPIDEDGKDLIKPAAKPQTRSAGYAAPTAAARAKTKVAKGKENAVVQPSSRKTHLRSKSTSATPSQPLAPKSAGQARTHTRPSALRSKSAAVAAAAAPFKTQFHTPADSGLFDFNIDDII